MGLDHPQGVVSDGQYAYVVTGGFERATTPSNELRWRAAKWRRWRQAAR
jgi:hypothetical protein